MVVHNALAVVLVAVVVYPILFGCVACVNPVEVASVIAVVLSYFVIVKMVIYGESVEFLGYQLDFYLEFCWHS